MENKDFAERNVGLVRALVPRFLGRGIEYDDLFQAGCEGLIKAAAHFDPDRGYKFSTYAVPVILGEMRRLFREGGTVKVFPKKSARKPGMPRHNPSPSPAMTKTTRRTFPSTHRKKKSPITSPCSKY